MEPNSKALRRNARFIYILIIVLGMVLSSFVYISTQRAEDKMLMLVEHDIPLLDQLKTLDALFIKQELFLNEYYANQRREMYQINFIQTFKYTNQMLENIDQKIDSKWIFELKNIQIKIQNIAAELDANLSEENGTTITDWDLARQQLEIISIYRREITPIVDIVIEDINKHVEQQSNETKRSLNLTIQTVLIYSFLILIVAVVIGRYMKQYLDVSAKNRRLALFPQRNPNPILSLDANNHVIYSNPATENLINDLNLTILSLTESLLEQLGIHQKKIKEEDISHSKFEIPIVNHTLECELHWLKDIETWDIHLVDISKRKQAEAQLQYQAFHHTETGLYNKNKLVQNLEVISEQPFDFAIGAIEVRQYSQIVSRLGLEQAALLIKELAEILNSLIEEQVKSDTFSFYHISDNQFTLLIDSDYSEADITQLTNDILQFIENTVFNNGVHIELDFGFCCFPKHANTPESLVRCVNIALDQAINTPNSSLVIYSQELGQTINNEIKLTSDLRNAIENNELQLYFQPQLNIHDNDIIGVETLIRWSTDKGFVSPAEFIPLAEKSGLIIPLGDWITLNAFKQAAELVKLGYQQIVVAINISPQQFKEPSFYDVIISSLEETKVPPENIELEITEGVIMYNENDTIELLHKLKALGLKLSIDDFGTGYSSLSYLKSFPIDKLKIDQSFIKKIEQNNSDKAIVNAIIDLGNNLGLTLIAEGVEEEEHLDILKTLNCDEIQGYFFSRPLPKAELLGFLADFYQK